MMKLTRKQVLLIGLGVLVLAAVVYGFWPKPVPVEMAVVRHGPLQVVVEEEGETQVENPYVISSPVAAYARRIDLEAGDPVERGQEVVRLEPPRAAILDPRTEAEAQARIETTQARLVQAQEQARAAETAATRADEERRRTERLQQAGSATQQMLEQATAEANQAQANLDAAQAAVAAARAELTAARAATQQGSEGRSNLPVLEVLRAPVTGRVLAVHRKSAGQVNPGEPLVDIGDTDSLEVHVDVISQDAVRITPGTRVIIDQWGGEQTLEAVVKRVEPQGFTEVSSLGVEEKRVTVVAELTVPFDQRKGLGAGYRVLARFVVWEGEDVLQVPTSALFRVENGWAVFAVEGGEAVRKTVDIGYQTGLWAQVLSGLTEGEEVIAHPDNAIEEGTRVEPREE